jgi:hypothetical protein
MKIFVFGRNICLCGKCPACLKEASLEGKALIQVEWVDRINDRLGVYDLPLFTPRGKEVEEREAAFCSFFEHFGEATSLKVEFMDGLSYEISRK